MNIPENILSKLTAEQKEKITSAASIEEVLSIVKDFGLELSDEQLEGLAGGTGPLGETGPLGAVGPVGSCDPANKTGPLNSCDPAANKTGPLGWYD